MYSQNMFLSNLTSTSLGRKWSLIILSVVHDHALTQVKRKLGENVQLTLLRKLLPFPEFYEDVLVHHPTNHLHGYLKDKKTEPSIKKNL